MKYIPAEKLIAEIERQQRKLMVLSSHTRQLDTKRDCSLQNGVYLYILSIIESLQQEQPEADLEKEICRWMDKLDDKYCMLVDNYSIQDIKDTARHFWNKGYNAIKEETK